MHALHGAGVVRIGEPTRLAPVLQLLSEHGFDGMAEVVESLLNAAMKLERCLALQADSYERRPERLGRANGFKPKTVNTRLGRLELESRRGGRIRSKGLER